MVVMSAAVVMASSWFRPWLTNNPTGSGKDVETPRREDTETLAWQWREMFTPSANDTQRGDFSKKFNPIADTPSLAASSAVARSRIPQILIQPDMSASCSLASEISNSRHTSDGVYFPGVRFGFCRA